MRIRSIVLAWAVLAAACTTPLTVDRLDDDPAASACLEGVPNDCSLRGAVLNANARPGLDTIVLPLTDVPFYSLDVAGGDEDHAATGDLDVRDDLVVQGERRESDGITPVIDGGYLDRVWDIDPAGSGVTASFTDVALQHGRARLDGSFPNGGLVLNRPQAVTSFAGCLLLGGAGLGGARLADAGGLVFNQGRLHVGDTLLEQGFAWRGGAISNGDPETGVPGGTVTIERSWIRDSGAFYEWSWPPPPDLGFQGGGVLNAAAGVLFVEDSTLSDNFAIRGGAVANYGEAVIDRSTVLENTAFSLTSGGFDCGPGGGLANFGTLGLINTTLTGNGGSCDPLQSDAGLANHGQAVVQNVTAADNGIANEVDGTVELANTLVARSGCLGSGMISDGGNLEGPGDTCGFDQPTDQSSVADTGIGALGGNGGPTRTHALGAGSPAIDHGVAITCPAVDQRGQPRGDGSCDAGAFERQPSDP